MLFEALSGILDMPVPDEVVENRKVLFEKYKPQEVRQMARYLLNVAGVWSQVLALIHKAGLVNYEERNPRIDADQP